MHGKVKSFRSNSFSFPPHFKRQLMNNWTMNCFMLHLNMFNFRIVFLRPRFFMYLGIPSFEWINQRAYIEWPSSIWALLARQRLPVWFHFNEAFVNQVFIFSLRYSRGCLVCRFIHHDLNHGSYKHTYNAINNLDCVNKTI